MNKSNLSPWQVKSSRIVHRDRWICLRADDCVTASGVEIAPYYVLEYRDWIHIVAITPGNEIVLVRQYRHALGAVSTEIPAGSMDAGERDPLVTAARDLEEETGYVSKDLRLVTRLSPNPATHSNAICLVLAMNAEPLGERNLDETEELEVMCVTCDEAVQMALSGGMVQALHASSLLIALAAAGVATWKTGFN
jgi:8-oxo-dGTP pyrophosphatase MutT (NUDIX family)